MDVLNQQQVSGSPQLGRIPRLDGLRGIAILIVMLRHFGLSYPVSTGTDQVVSTFLLAGWCGVDLFFVLSGFLISGILIETRGASNYFRSFWARRALRIFPVYYTFLAMWFLVLPRLLPGLGLHADLGEDHYLPYLTYTVNLFGTVPQISHLWSLSVEEQFYLLWPIVIWVLPNRRLALVCVALVLVCPVIRVLLDSFPPSPDWPLRLFSRADSLAFGALIAIGLREEAWHALIQRSWKWVLAGSVLGAATVCLALGGVDLQASNRPLSAIGISFIGAGFAALLAGTLFATSGSRVAGWLEWSWLRTLGKYSYGLYLFHGPLAHIAMHALPATRLWPWLQWRSVYVAFMLVCMGLSFGIAFASWHIIEKRILSFKDRFAADLPNRPIAPGGGARPGNLSGNAGS